MLRYFKLKKNIKNYFQPTKKLCYYNTSQQTKVKSFKYSTQNLQENHERHQLQGHMKKKIIVIGAGVIGITTSYTLIKDGYDVILIESEKTAAQITSKMNGCIMDGTSPHMVNKHVTKQMFESKFLRFFGLDFDWTFMQQDYFFRYTINMILLSFTQKMENYNKTTFRYLTGNIIPLLSKLREDEKTIESMLSETISEVLEYYDNQEQVEEQVKAYQNFGIEFERIQSVNDFLRVTKKDFDQKVVKQMLSQYKFIYTKLAKVVNTQEFCHEMIKILRTQYPGQFQEIYDCTFDKFIKEKNSEKYSGIVTKDQKQIFGDYIIICAGNGTKYILNQIGVKLPVIGLGGCTMNIPCYQQSVNHPARHFILQSSTFYACKINDDYYRVAGLGLGYQFESKDRINRQRLSQFLLDEFNKKLKCNYKLDECQVSFCWRPMSPDDHPVISKIPKTDNVFVNSNQGFMGTGWALGSSNIIRDLINNINKPEYAAYDIKRFYFL